MNEAQGRHRSSLSPPWSSSSSLLSHSSFFFPRFERRGWSKDEKVKEEENKSSRVQEEFLFLKIELEESVYYSIFFTG